MNDDLGTLLQGRDQVLQNLDAILVSPIVKDGLEIVDIRLDRLRCKEVAIMVVSKSPV
jgi:hypothetical protein